MFAFLFQITNRVAIFDCKVELDFDVAPSNAHSSKRRDGGTLRGRQRGAPEKEKPTATAVDESNLTTEISTGGNNEGKLSETPYDFRHTKMLHMNC
jgi:hypothetical protein